ncbi:DUF4202 domain-containing protein [Zobellella taiwanensis]|jgi:hypothetical protein|uniref:DUF4202 domain-containing protein n=1 Tax=Zobellella taiwanensis TaxID=347535 RepID=A0A2P7QGX0_9GAMM|nr:DUF4202 domain-containing protein [Zobellella taiwanensis]PSJ37209.1 DUF4202 domain-containing protein [Zobellella taiwanensis]
MSHSSPFAQVIAAIDHINREDPHRQRLGEVEWPREYLYSVRMSEQLAAFAPQASELLQIAARAQHIRRWAIPRTDYPMDRNGYRRWRSDLAKYHGELAAGLMANAGYTAGQQQRVRDLLEKKQLKHDPEVQTLEDVICLVFLRDYLADFAARHQRDKVVGIIRKTWGKMSQAGQQAALALPLEAGMAELVAEALEG